MSDVKPVDAGQSAKPAHMLPSGAQLSLGQQTMAEADKEFWEKINNPEPFDGTNIWISGRPPVKPNSNPAA